MRQIALLITNIQGDSETLTLIRDATFNSKVNGEKLLTFSVSPNDPGFDFVIPESIIQFRNAEYIIRRVNEKDFGNKTYKQVEAVHRFFIDMIDCFQYQLHTGSQTFVAALSRVFGPTPYHFQVIGSFGAEEFENFGRDNCLSLFKTVLERYGAEFTVQSRTVTIQKRIGQNTDFQFRWGVNLKAIDKQEDTDNFSTHIEGFGGEEREDGTFPVHEKYTSPNAKIFGIRHAEPVYDERRTVAANMQQHLRDVLIDEPQLSVTVSLADLRQAGYASNYPEVGDWGFIVYEPMNNFVAEARIVEVTETLNALLEPIDIQVTLSNVRQRMTETVTRFANTSKKLDRILAGQDKVPMGGLADAVRIATNALLSARTELNFEDGIKAISKVNSNHIVLFNSAGIGISTDGLQTFRNAITAFGVVAESIMAGVITQGGSRSVMISGGYVYTFDGNDLNASFGQHGLEFFALNGDLACTLYPSRSISNPNVRGATLTMEPNAYFSIAYQQGQHRYQSFDTSQERGQTIVAGAVRSQQQGSRLSMYANAAMIGADLGNSIFGSRVTDQAHMQLIQTSSRNNVQIGFGGYTNRNDSVFELVHNLNAEQVTVMMTARSNGVTFPSYSTWFGQRQARISPVSNGVQWTAGNGNYIYQHESNGQVEIYMGGRMMHAFKADGTKQGGAISVDDELLGMSPVDSPQYLIEYMIMDVEPGKRIFIDERFLKAVGGKFAIFPANGASLKKDNKSFVVGGAEPTDVRIVGERYDKAGAFWQLQDDWANRDQEFGPANIDVTFEDRQDDQIKIEDQEAVYNAESRETARARAASVTSYVIENRGTRNELDHG
ncbi:phage tail protein [Shouchella clausii]|uniref:phage tail protein n=1 Tax=Shouchella clausii TaxID=79880 RepID=UPI00289CDD16|nr:phage tail protein [Shouchella clausii]